MDIENWVNSLSTENAQLISKIVDALRLESELTGRDAFPVPSDKIKEFGISKKDEDQILYQLSKHKAVSYFWGDSVNGGFKTLLEEGLKTLGDGEFFPKTWVKIESDFPSLASTLRKRLSKAPFDEKVVRFENNSFTMRLLDGSVSAVNFSTKNGTNNDMLDIFDIMFGLLKQEPELIDGWWEVRITKDQLRRELQKKGKISVSDNFLKDTIGNIRNTKVKPSGLSGYISIENFDRKNKNWPFKIKNIQN